jgi:hypothetical protein
MIEIIIDHWSRGGHTTYLWSAWRDRTRVAQGDAHVSAEAAEAAFYRAELGEEPDEATRL